MNINTFSFDDSCQIMKKSGFRKCLKIDLCRKDFNLLISNYERILVTKIHRIFVNYLDFQVIFYGDKENLEITKNHIADLLLNINSK